VSTTWLGIRLTVFVLLYVLLFVVDIWLMRRYAGRDLSTEDADGGETAPAAAY
jgi:cytochrome bd-type quinol oxidase subunit 1